MGSAQLGSTWLELGLAWICFGMARLGSARLGLRLGLGLGLGLILNSGLGLRSGLSLLDSAWLGPVPARGQLSQHGSVWLGSARKSMHLLTKISIICKTTRTENSMIASNYVNGKFGCGLGLACFASVRLDLGWGWVCLAGLVLAHAWAWALAQA